MGIILYRRSATRRVDDHRIQAFTIEFADYRTNVRCGHCMTFFDLAHVVRQGTTAADALRDHDLAAMAA
jgi:hypothetical protein